MTMLTEYTVSETVPDKPVLSIRGRPIIFTPERIDQVRNLRERGKTVEEIAEIIGCTVGTLRVKCSNLGISLRTLVSKNIMMLKKNGDNGNGEAIFKPVLVPPLNPDFSLQLSYRGRTRTVSLNLPPQIIAMFAMEAEMRGIPMSELFAAIIIKAMERNLVDELLSPLPSNSE